MWVYHHELQIKLKFVNIYWYWFLTKLIDFRSEVKGEAGLGKKSSKLNPYLFTLSFVHAILTCMYRSSVHSFPCASSGISVAWTILSVSQKASCYYYYYLGFIKLPFRIVLFMYMYIICYLFIYLLVVNITDCCHYCCCCYYFVHKILM